MPAVVDRSRVRGTGVVVEARTAAVGTPTGGRPRTATRFFRRVYDAPEVHYLAAWELRTGGSVAEEASESAMAAVSGGADGAVDGGPVRALVPRVTSDIGRPAAVNGPVTLRRRAVCVELGGGCGGYVADGLARAEGDPLRSCICAIHALAGTFGGGEKEDPG